MKTEELENLLKDLSVFSDDERAMEEDLAQYLAAGCPAEVRSRVESMMAEDEEFRAEVETRKADFAHFTPAQQAALEKRILALDPAQARRGQENIIRPNVFAEQNQKPADALDAAEAREATNIIHAALFFDQTLVNVVSEDTGTRALRVRGAPAPASRGRAARGTPASQEKTKLERTFTVTDATRTKTLQVELHRAGEHSLLHFTTKDRNLVERTVLFEFGEVRGSVRLTESEGNIAVTQSINVPCAELLRVKPRFNLK